MTFKKDQKAVYAALEEVAKDEAAAAALEKALESGSGDAGGFAIEPGMVSFKRTKKMVRMD